jgi:hypothetical protein
VPFIVQSVDADIAEAIRWHLRPFLQDPSRSWGGGVQVEIYVQDEDEGTDPPVYSFVSGQVLRARTADLRELLSVVLARIYRSVGGYLRDYLFLSGSAVSRDGRAVMLVGDHGSADSLRLLGLLQTGWTYISNGDVAVDPVTSRVQPYPRTIELTQSDLDAWPGITEALEDHSAQLPTALHLDSRHVRPSDVGAGQAERPATVSAVVVVEDGGGGSPQLTTLGHEAAVAALVDRCSNRRFYPDLTEIVFRRLLDGATTVHALRGGSPTEQAFLLDETLR